MVEKDELLVKVEVEEDPSCFVGKGIEVEGCGRGEPGAGKMATEPADVSEIPEGNAYRRLGVGRKMG